LHDAFKSHFGKNGPILVWRAPTRVMNPTVPKSIIDAALERDHESAKAEWLAEFRSDISSFIDRETVLACVEKGIRERAPKRDHRYFSFTDPSGGSADSMTAAVGHVEKDCIIVDAIREIAAPFDPESAVAEIAQLFKNYGLRKTTGDRYSAQWCATAFQRHGIEYAPCDLNKSALYLELLPRLNAKTIKLLDHERAVNQIAALERRTARGGRDSIDHSPGSHDDISNSIAGLAGVQGAPSRGETSFGMVHGLH
jgi:hypothetical protein